MARAVTTAIIHRTRLYTCLEVGVQSELYVAGTSWPMFCFLTDVLTATITIVTRQFAVSVILGELEARSALAGDASFRSLSTDVSAAVVLIHTARAFFSAVNAHFGPLDAGVLVVRQEESLFAATLVTPHHVHTHLLAASVTLRTLVHIQTVMAIVG